MELKNIFLDKFVLSTISFIGAVLLTWVTQQILNKRGVFSYSVRHNRVGVSTDDAIFGSVRVTLGGVEVPNLYLSTIELRNESNNDYENVHIRTYTNDTNLLNEHTELLGTSYILEWAAEYKVELAIGDSGAPTEAQKEIHRRRRDYIVPAVNRGQVVKFTYLNSARTNVDPSIWVDVVEKGIKAIYRPPINQVHGVPAPYASVVGVFGGVLLAVVLIALESSLSVAVWVSLFYGLIAQLPGAYFIKGWRRIKEFIGG